MNAPGAVLERARARLVSRAFAPGGLLLAYVLLSLAALIVLSVGQAPFAVDLPNHATRLFIQCNADDPLLSRMWTVEYGIIPNLAVDLINQPLCGLVDPMTVVRGAMILSLAGILLLVWKIHRLLHGAPNAFVLLAPAMSFNIITIMGYVNYLIGVFLFLFFAWSVLRYRLLDRHPVLSIALPNLFGTLLFFCHVFALALAGLFLFGMRLGMSGRPLLHRAVRAGLWSAAGFAAPLLLMLLAERSGVGFDYSFVGKVRALWAPLLYASVAAAALLVLLWTMLFIWAFRERHVRIHPAMRWPLVLLAAFSLLLPSGMLDAVDLDSRSLVATAFLAIAAIGPRQPGGPLAAPATIAAAALALMTLLVQIGTAIPVMRQYQQDVAEFRASTAAIEPLRTLFSFRDPDRRPFAPPPQVYAHLTSYAARDRRAFNPFQFTGAGMQPLRARPSYACVDVPAGHPMSRESAALLLSPDPPGPLANEKFRNVRYAHRWDTKFDYVIHYHFGARSNPFPQLLQPVRDGSFFTIFAVRSGRSPGPPHCAAPAGRNN